MNTTFDPAVHGFAFRNRFAGSHVLSELSRQGRLDEIVGLDLPGPLSGALELAARAEFWDGFGLCGGMSWCAVDEFLADSPPDPAEQPEPGSELFSTLVSRQADSFQGRELIGKLIEWLPLPTSNPWWGFFLESMGRRVAELEWPSLKASIDQGQPQVLCLIRSHRPDKIADNHQVVAIGYTETGREVSVSLYDPNHPRQKPTLDFTTGSFLNKINLTQSTGEPIVGFFVWPHRARMA